VTFQIPEPIIDKPVTSQRLAGKQIDSSDKHPSNAEAAIEESREPGSKLTFDIFLQFLKHHLQILSSDEGMQID
jgi:hypothetical protein